MRAQIACGSLFCPLSAHPVRLVMRNIWVLCWCVDEVACLLYMCWLADTSPPHINTPGAQEHNHSCRSARPNSNA